MAFNFTPSQNSIFAQGVLAEDLSTATEDHLGLFLKSPAIDD